jgi:hypothetical protein
MTQIALCVIGVHGALLLLFMIQEGIRPVNRKRVVVNTVRIAPAPKPVVAHKPATVVASAPKPKVKAQVPKKAVVSKPAPTEVRTESALKELEESVAKMAAGAPTAKPAIDVPILDFEIPEESPTERIASYLQEVLQLPEFGQVKVDLIIDRFGKLEKMEIVESESEKNGEFLRNQLPELHFPCLNKTISLTIVFSNA